MVLSEKYPEHNLLLELCTDDVETYIIEVEPDNMMFTKFILIWGDYVANTWEEEYDCLSTALARAATLIYCTEQDAANDHTAVFFKLTNEDFPGAWNTFIDKSTEVVK